MNLRIKLSLFIILAVESVVFLISIVTFFLIKNYLFENITNVLDLRLHEKTNIIENYLDANKRRLNTIISSTYIETILSPEYESVVLDIKRNIKGVAIKVSNDISKYLEANPTKTVSDLQRDNAFKDIAVQEVYAVGYTAVYEADSLICRFHKQPTMINRDLNELSELLPDFWDIIVKTKGGNEFEGFYDWEENSEKLSQKYMYAAKVPYKTKDNKTLMVAATAYVQDYAKSFQLLRNADSNLKAGMLFDDASYLDLIILNKHGDILFTATDSSILGENVNTLQNGSTQLKNLFDKAVSSSSVITDICVVPQQQGVKRNYACLLTIAPIYSNDTLVGFAISKFGIQQVIQALSSNNIATFGTSSNIYLVARDTKIFGSDKMSANIELNENILQQCLSSTTSDISKLHTQGDRSKSFLKFQYIPEFDSCLFAELPVSPVTNILNRVLILLIIANFLAIGCALILSQGISQHLTTRIEDIKQGLFNLQVMDIPNVTPLDLKAPEKLDDLGELKFYFTRLVEFVNSIQQTTRSVGVKLVESSKLQNKELKEQQMALLNALEDIEVEKNRIQRISIELQKFKLAVENTAEGIIITDSNGIILFVNRAMEAITGFSPEEVIGKKAGGKGLWGGQMEPYYYKSFWKIISKDKKTFNGYIKNKTKSGTLYDAQIVISPVLDDHQEVLFFVGVQRDITREKEVDRMKTEFISLASHQLRTPLSAIKWFLEMLLDGDAGELTTEQREYVEKVNLSNTRMIALVNALLDISRIESGRIIVEPELTNLDSLIKEVLVEVEDKVKEKKLKLNVIVPSDLPLINLDPKLIRNVYMNLLTNSIKYTPESGEVSIIISMKDNDIISQVSDNGYGVPKKEQHKLFDKFYRGSNIIEKVTEGTGLGLYLVQAIIRSSNGRLWFKSEENKGTSFWFSLPIEGVPPKKGEVRLGS